MVVHRGRPHPSQPVLWYELIKEMEEFNQKTAWGLARSWGHVHKSEYDLARASFDETVETYESIEGRKLVEGR